MKKQIGRHKYLVMAAVLAFASLCGCGKESDNTAGTSGSVSQAETSSMENGTPETGKERTVAIKDSHYSLKNHLLLNSENIYELNISPWTAGDNVLNFVLVYQDDYLFCLFGDNQIVILNPLDGSVLAQQQVPNGYYYSETIFIDENGNIALYDIDSRIMYFYDSKLTQYNSVNLSQYNITTLYMNRDFSKMAFVTFSDPKLHTYDFATETEESYEVGQSSSMGEYVSLCGYSKPDNQVLVCYCDGNWDNLKEEYFLWNLDTNQRENTDVGSIRYITASEDYYIAESYTEGVSTYICGNRKNNDSHVYQFDDSGYGNAVYHSVKDYKSVVLKEEIDWESSYQKETLQLHDLEKGVIAETQFENNQYTYITNAVYMPEAHLVAFGCNDSTSRLCVWDLLDETSAYNDTVNHIYSLGCLEGKDAALNAELENEVEHVRNDFHIDIIYDEAVLDCPITDYTYGQEKNSLTVRTAIHIIEQELEKYPSEMFEQMEQGEDGILHLYLSSQITGADDNTLSYAGGVQNTFSGNRVILLDISSVYSIKENLHHEMYHAFESYMYSVNWELIDDTAWCNLNPEGFDYTYTYEENDYDYDSDRYSYVFSFGEPDGAYFTGYYSMTYPHEDRAAIFASAMMEKENKVGYFESSNIRSKLRLLDEWIRTCFDTVDWQQQAEWEQWMTAN